MAVRALAPASGVAFKRRASSVRVAALSLLVSGLLAAPGANANGYAQVNLVSDLPGIAAHQDASLVNPWGISHSAGSPLWVSDNGTGVSTLYNGAGIKQGLVVTIPGDGSVTGQVFNSASGAGAFNADVFLFVSEDGTISGWRGALGTTAETLQIADADNSYKGSALATLSGHTYLYSTNFATGNVDILKGDGAAPNLAGGFQDPNLPSGFAPFGIQTIGNTIYVTYAVVGPSGDDVAGAGNGIVDAFDLNGNLVSRLVSNGSGSPLNSPWGLVIAPAAFGEFGGDLLVGNFGDGKINAFDPVTGEFKGTLADAGGNPIVIEGLWGLIFGNGGNGGFANTLYFTAGISDPSTPTDEVESHGLLGALFAPEPGTWELMLAGFAALAFMRRRMWARAS